MLVEKSQNLSASLNNAICVVAFPNTGIKSTLNKVYFLDCIASGKVREPQVITACVVITVIKMRDRANGRQREIVKGAVKGVTRVTVLLISHLGLLCGGVLLCRGDSDKKKKDMKGFLSKRWAKCFLPQLQLVTGTKCDK